MGWHLVVSSASIKDINSLTIWTMIIKRFLLITSIVGFSAALPVDYHMCDRIYRAMSLNETTGEETPSPIDINFCKNQIEPLENFECSFNSSQCENTCDIVGFEKNPLGCQISCNCITSGFLEEDIRFQQEDLPIIRKAYSKRPVETEDAASVGLNIWDQQRVGRRVKIPFIFSRNLNQKARNAIGHSIVAYSKETCIDFVQRTNESDYIHFTSKGGCWSFIGRRGGKQDVSIGYGCEWNGVVEHELMHALGFWHEQSRPDRDEHITVRFENVLAGKEHNFKKRASVFSMGSPYDLHSLMQYSGFAFSKNLRPTMLVKATNLPVESQRIGLSSEDRIQINSLYKCSSTRAVTLMEWGAWRKCSVTCGEGIQRRERECVNLLGQTSEGCEGSLSEVRTCMSEPCITTTSSKECATWGEWKDWGECSKSCGDGYQWRYRQCSEGYSRCLGSAWERRQCNAEDCFSNPDYSVFGGSPWKSEQEICKDGKIFVGDFNGDRKHDLLCFFSDHWITLFYASRNGTFGKNYWSGRTAACKMFQRPGKVMISDLNGDGSDDLICHDPTTGNITVSFSTMYGFKEEVDLNMKLLDFCDDEESTLLIQDVDGDNMSDLICKDTLGFISVLRNV